MNRAAIIAFPLLALVLASCSSSVVSLYSGEMDLISVSGSGCPEQGMSGPLPLNLSLEQSTSSGGRPIINGYFNGPDMQSGYFSGTDLSRLQVAYPDEPGSDQGHTLALSMTPQGMNGELHEKPQPDSTNCYFVNAGLKLKRQATGSEARSGYDRLRKLFSAEAHHMSGQSLLKGDRPEEAIREFTRSLELRNEVDPGGPDRAYPLVSLAIAHIMAGREAEAMALVRGLLGEKQPTEDAAVKQRMAVSIALCNDEEYLDGEAERKAAIRLMDSVAREFGSLDGVAVPLAACYFDMGKERKEEDDPDGAMGFFRKAAGLNPDNPDGITGVVMSFADKDDPAGGRKYLQDHEQIFVKRAGKESYGALMAFLYSAEAQQAGKGSDLPRAEALSREAAKARPNEPTLVISLSRVLGREGKFAEARSVLEDGGKVCRDDACRKEYADESARQELIERMVRRIEAPGGRP